jgi:dienelactone hydrolase
LLGDLYLPGPPGNGPWPGVLLLGGSEGGRPDPAYAAALAGHGYAVLGLAYFDEPGLPSTLTRVPVEYGLEAARWLADHVDTGGPQIAVVGTSKGAEYALLLASSAPERFAAVVSHVGSDVVWPALAFDPAAGPQSSWSRGGAGVPFIGWAPAAGGGAPPAPDGPVRVAAAYAGAFAGASPEQRAAARIPVERIAAPVLLTSGGDDGIWPSGPQAQRLMEVMSAAGNPHGSRHLHFPGAGHFVGGVPDLPTTGTVIAAGPIRIESGGEPAAIAEAVRRTWTATLELLEEALRR